MAVPVPELPLEDALAEKWRAPFSVSREELLVDGSDKPYQWLMYNLWAVFSHLEASRNVVAKKFGVTGPQYSILMAIARFQEDSGISASAVARLLNVSTAFITTETGKLIERGLLVKERSPDDRRVVLLKISPAGQTLIDRYSPLIRRMNDTLLGEFTAEEFRALSKLVGGLVKSSARTAEMLRAADVASARPASPSGCTNKRSSDPSPGFEQVSAPGDYQLALFFRPVVA